MLGESINAQNMCRASFGDIVLVPVDNGVQRNSVEKSRRKECIYLYPKSNKQNSHELLVLDSIEKPSHVVIKAAVKSTAVLPYTPLSIVARINAQSVKEKSKLGKSRTWTQVEEAEFREATGFSDDLILDTPPDLLHRDSRTTQIQPLSSTYVTECTSKGDDLIDKVSYTTSLVVDSTCFVEVMDENHAKIDSFFSYYTDSLSIDDYEDFSYVTKKEVNYDKALKIFDVNRVKSKMKDELGGLVTKWHPVFTSSLTEEANSSWTKPIQGQLFFRLRDLLLGYTSL
jgi:hypothetical protein